MIPVVQPLKLCIRHDFEYTDAIGKYTQILLVQPNVNF